MFSVFLNGPQEDTTNSLLIYEDIKVDEYEYSLIDPKLTVEDNTAGSFEFEVPVSNVGYDRINPYRKDTDVYIYKKGYIKTYGDSPNIDTDDIYWAGRITSMDRGIDNHKVIYCEGVLGFLNDTIQTPQKYTTTNTSGGNTLDTYITFLLTRHNNKVSPNRRIYKGLITVTYEPTDWFTNYESTMEVIQDIVSATNGHIRIRRGFAVINNVRVRVWKLDILTDEEWDSTKGESNKWKYIWQPNPDQQLEYGANILDLKQNYELSDLITVVYPLGKRKDDTDVEGVDEYYSINGNTQLPLGFSDIVEIAADPSAPTRYFLRSKLGAPNWGNPPQVNDEYIGHFATTVTYDDVTDANELAKLGILSLTLPNTISYEIEASALDQSYRDRSLSPLEVHDLIEVYAPEHDVFFAKLRVSKAEIPLDNPFDGSFSIGGIISRSFTGLTTKNIKNIVSGIKYLTVKPAVTPDPQTPDPPAG